MNKFVSLTILSLAMLVGFALAGPDAQAGNHAGCSSVAAAGCSGAASASCAGSHGVHRGGFFRRLFGVERRQARRAARAARYAHSYGCGAAAGCGGSTYAAAPVQYRSSGNCPSGLCPR